MATKTKSSTITRKCRNAKCGKTFHAKDERTRYCSHACGNRHRHNTWFKRAGAALRQLKAKGVKIVVAPDKPKRATKHKLKAKATSKRSGKNKVAKRATVKARVRVHVKAKPEAGEVTGVTTESLPT
jgi:beta-phosphoglucomutase-like phosphatase (HAD superfamily)